MEMKIQTKPSLSMNIVNAETGIGMNVNTGGGSSSKQVYRGPDYPTKESILIWIDTSEPTPPPITGIQLLTADNLQFKTSDNKAFILSEITPNALLTKDNKEFIEANNKKFILREEN